MRRRVVQEYFFVRVSGLSTQQIQCERLALIAKAHYSVSAPILPHVPKDRFVLFTSL